jgi:hypothetical protein
MRATLLVAVLLCGPAYAGGLGSGTLGDSALGGVGLGGSSMGVGGVTVAAPTLTITVPAADPTYVSSASAYTISGTTTGSVSSVAYAGSGAGACSTGAGTFSCSVTPIVGTNTITVTATNAGGTGSDTVSQHAPTFLVDYSLMAVGTNVCSASAQLAGGTATPSTCTRATTAYRRHLSSGSCGSSPVFTLTSVASGDLRISEVCEGSTLRRGVLIEPAATNLAPKTSDLADAAWTKTNVSISANVATPTGLTAIADALESTDAAGDVEHYVRTSETLTAATHTMSALMKAGAVGYAFLRDNTVANARAFFDLSTCSPGTVAAGMSRSATTVMGNGWCFVEGTFLGTAAAHDLDFGCAATDNDLSYDDGTNSTDDCIIVLLQAEAQPSRTSPIDNTGTTTAARNADVLRYSPTSNVDIQNAFTFEATAWMANVGFNIQTLLSAYGDANNNAHIYHSAADFPQASASSGGATTLNVQGVGNVSDGVTHTLRGTFATNALTLYYDGSSTGTPDVSGALPAAVAASIGVGVNNTSNQNAPTLIQRVLIRNEACSPATCP